MNTELKYKLKKLSPMNYKKLNKNIDDYFIKLDNNWFNLVDIHECLNLNQLNPITKKKLTIIQQQKIKNLYKEITEIDTDNNEKLLTDYIELFESQINELQANQEELYALSQTHHHEIEKLNNKNIY
tara:strand:+ start:1095 stop:1475 length:381 start_codon:yes stop_codon:yes gene_type:complete